MTKLNIYIYSSGNMGEVRRLKISEHIDTLCERLNISKAELARRIGKSPQSLNGKLRRESFTVPELERIAEATGVQYLHKFVHKDGRDI